MATSRLHGLKWVSGGYLVSTVQKGFMRDVAGCVEHSETIYRAALDTRTHGRDLCMSWIDLANAYGSVNTQPDPLLIGVVSCA